MTDRTPCRAVSPVGIGCAKPRAHKYNDFSTRNHHTDPDGKAFKGGIKTPAHWYVREIDDGHRSEADYQTWMRL